MGKSKQLFNHMREQELNAVWQEQEYLLYTLPRQKQKSNNKKRKNVNRSSN